VRILFVTGREINYPRNAVLLRAFRRFAQVDVIASEQRPRSLLRHSLNVTQRPLPHLLRGGHDVVFVGFYGHMILRALGGLVRRPLLFDAFLSTYDTLCFDRRDVAPDSCWGRLAYGLDRSSARRASHVLLDTPQHVVYFTHTFELPAHKFSAVPVGCQEDIFTPQPAPLPRNTTRVLYYSSYLPLHGVDTVVRAAARLRDLPIHLRLIGRGPDFARTRQLADQLGLSNITFAPPVALNTLANEIANADLCLGGHFGGSDKAARVVPGKIYQMLAMGRPIIATGTPANSELLQHGESAYLIPQRDPAALAAAIRRLHYDQALRTRLSRGGRVRYDARCSEAVITEQLHAIVGGLVHNATRPDIYAIRDS